MWGINGSLPDALYLFLIAGQGTSGSIDSNHRLPHGLR